MTLYNSNEMSKHYSKNTVFQMNRYAKTDW